MELVKQIRQRIRDHPEEYAELMTAINAGFAEYLEFEKSKRDMLAMTAVNSLLMVAEPDSYVSLGWYIDIAWFYFPRGVDGHGKKSVQFWDLVIEKAREGVDRTWIIETRGVDRLKWWDEYVHPHLKRNEENV